MDLDILDELASLSDKSLLRLRTEELDEPRVEMLQMIREYALERLAERGELEALRQQHADYYLTLAETLEPELVGARQGEALDKLELEHDNLRATLSWFLERRDQASAMRLSGALWRFWYAHGHLSEGRRWLADVLAVAREDQAEPALRAKVNNAAGILAWTQSDYRAARAFLEQSLAIRSELADKPGIALALNNLGLVSMDQGDYARARALYEESLAIGRELGDRRAIGLALSNLGSVARLQHDYRNAQQFNEESLTIWRGLDDQWSIATVLSNLGYLFQVQDDHPAADRLYTESLTIRRALGDKEGIAECLEGLAWSASTQGRFVQAARLCWIAQALRDAIGSPLPAAERAIFEQTLASVHAGLDPATQTALHAELQVMPLEEAVGFVLDHAL